MGRTCPQRYSSPPATMSPMTSWWARAPLRIKLALAFTGVMAILLVGASVTLSLLSAANLDRAIDDGLEARAGDAAALVRPGARSGRLRDSGEALAQVLDPSGRVLDTTPGAGSAPLLTPDELKRAMAGGVTAERTGEAEGRLPVPPSHDEISRLGYTLNAMLGRLQGVLARERSFVSDASHELRTPLAILRTELELALRGRSTRAELEDAVRSAAEETDRLNQLADDLLVIARSDQGRLPVRPAELDARELLEGVVHRFAARARAEQRTLCADNANGLTLTADRARVEQALANMVDNALRHGRGDVVLSAGRDNAHTELHVRDDGPGFPVDFLPAAFERFSRADEARSRGGTGLGLAITAAVARAHGGEAHAANRDGGGADVWLELPDSFSSSVHGSGGS